MPGPLYDWNDEKMFLVLNSCGQTLEQYLKAAGGKQNNRWKLNTIGHIAENLLKVHVTTDFTHTLCVFFYIPWI